MIVRACVALCQTRQFVIRVRRRPELPLASIDSNRFVPAVRPNAKTGNTQKGKKKGLFSRAPLQLPVIFYCPKNGENTCNVRCRGTPTHVLCAAQTIPDGEAFSVWVITHTLRSRRNMVCHRRIKFRRKTENNVVIKQAISTTVLRYSYKLGGQVRSSIASSFNENGIRRNEP